MPCRVVTAKWVVSCTRITCIHPLSRFSLTLLASSFFSESVVVVFSLFPPSYHHAFFLFFIFGLLATSYPLVSLPVLGQPFCISLVACICLHHDASSSVVLISVLLYQSAAFVFLDGSRVSEGLVMVSLAFHLFVVGTFIFALCSYDCSRPLLCCRQ